jgi:hypothetical protein
MSIRYDPNEEGAVAPAADPSVAARAPKLVNGKMLTPLYGTKEVYYGGRKGTVDEVDYSQPIGYEEYLPNHMVNSYDASGKFLRNYSNAQGDFLSQLGPIAPVLAAVGIDLASGGALSGALSSIFGGGGTAAGAAGAAEAAGAAGAAGAGAAADLGAAGAGLTSGAGTTGLSAIANPSLAAGAPLTAAAPAAAGMGGGTGLTALSNIGAAAGAPLAAAGAVAAGMGGGTGLTVPAAGGGTVGAGGVPSFCSKASRKNGKSFEAVTG